MSPAVQNIMAQLLQNNGPQGPNKKSNNNNNNSNNGMYCFARCYQTILNKFGVENCKLHLNKLSPKLAEKVFALDYHFCDLRQTHISAALHVNSTSYAYEFVVKSFVFFWLTLVCEITAVLSLLRVSRTDGF